MKVYLKRYLSPFLLQDLKQKILLITGPRQCGKTTLVKNLGPSFEYLNYDDQDQRKAFLDKSWDRQKQYIIFDELHKKKNWKLWLKALYDTEGLSPGMVVTGSARLETYRKTGDSLAGRFFHFRLHPFDLKEAIQLKICSPETALQRISQFSPFPEPFLKASPSFYGKWRRSHLNIILRQDIFQFESLRSISSLETLVQLLRDRVGSPLSYAGLAEDLHCAPKTVKHWLSILENLYIVFKVTPYHRNLARSLIKSPKYYFYDSAQVRSFPACLENITACALLKELNFREDVKGEEWQLFYLRNKDKKEVDFLITKETKPVCLIEVKTTQDSLSKSLNFFAPKFKTAQKVQIVQNLKREKTFPNGVEMRKAVGWLSRLPF